MSHTSTPQILLPSDPIGAMPMPAVQPQFPGLPSSDESVRMLPVCRRCHHTAVNTRSCLLTVAQQLPGVRCPTCAANGQETWVIPGRACGNCGTPCC
ncbi:hypothetical protein BR93DRAFT_926810 [Coniochaeta sp. PMI_546]|nr:hypothetical protein BR93DRAFT_926810 [Coniochaeta sp. PMI_546]